LLAMTRVFLQRELAVLIFAQGSEHLRLPLQHTCSGVATAFIIASAAPALVARIMATLNTIRNISSPKFAYGE
jgi:hypothetical protein